MVFLEKLLRGGFCFVSEISFRRGILFHFWEKGQEFFECLGVCKRRRTKKGKVLKIWFRKTKKADCYCGLLFVF